MAILRLVLGILNLLACVSLVVLHILIDWHGAASAFTWGLPFLIAAIAALFGGSAILKWKELGCAVHGLIIAGLGWFYFLILLWITGWTMA